MAARRKNATRESTATLKAWLNEHKKNPYPTKGEKIMLAIITKMTLTQVCLHQNIDFHIWVLGVVNFLVVNRLRTQGQGSAIYT